MTRPCVLSAAAALFVFSTISACAPAADEGRGGQGGSQSTQPGSGGNNSGSAGNGGNSSAGGNSGRGGAGGGNQTGSGGSTAAGGSTGSGGSSGSGGRPAGSGGQAGSAAAGGASGSGGVSGSDAGMADAGTTPDTTAAAGPKLSTDVLPIIKASCARAGCHDPVKKEHGMDLSTAATIHAGWVNKMTADHCMNNAAVTRVVPGMPDRSFVVTLVKNLTTRCAEVRRMPPAPFPALTAAEVKTITDWVAAGALNN